MKELKIVQVEDLGSIGQLYALIDVERKKILATHSCSDRYFAYSDLWGRRNDIRKLAKALYGEDCKAVVCLTIAFSQEEYTWLGD